MRLVIDASALRSAGGLGALAPVSINCRDALLHVLKFEHIIIVNKEIKAEWDEHKSRFSSRWLQQMYARRRIKNVDTKDCSDIRIAVLSRLHKPIERAAADKDFLLIRAAINGDNIIISLDEIARALYSQTSTEIIEISVICWINASNYAYELCTFLSGKTLINRAWKL